jgi:hypothetical protein
MERLSTLTQSQLTEHAVHDCMKYLACLATWGGHEAAAESFLERWPRAVHAPVVKKHLDGFVTKAAVAPGSTLDPSWAGVLTTPTELVEPVLATIQRESLLRINGLKRVPFLTPVPYESAKGTYGWVGQGAPKPVTKLGFGSVSLAPTKIVGTVALDAELLTLGAPFAAPTMSRAIIGGLVEYQDGQMFDPNVSEIANVRPASLTNGVSPVTATGDLDADVAKLLGALYTARPGAAKPTLVMAPASAGKLAASGTHPQLTVDGGIAFGVPVVTSAGVGAVIAAIDAAATIYADNGLVLDTSRTADVQMDDAPTTNATAIPSSLWQHNRVGIKGERIVAWKIVPGAVQFFEVAP